MRAKSQYRRINFYSIILFWILQCVSFGRCRSDVPDLPSALMSKVMNEISTGQGPFSIPLIIGTTYVPLKHGRRSENISLPIEANTTHRYNIFTEITAFSKSNPFDFVADVSATGLPGSTFTLGFIKRCEASEWGKGRLFPLKWMGLQEGTFFGANQNDMGCLSSGQVKFKKDDNIHVFNLTFPPECSLSTTMKNSIVIVQSQKPISNEGVMSYMVSGQIDENNMLQIKTTYFDEKNAPDEIVVGYIILSENARFGDIYSNMAVTGTRLADNGEVPWYQLPEPANCGVPIVLSSPSLLESGEVMAPFVLKDETFSLENTAMRKIYFTGHKVECPKTSNPLPFKDQMFIIFFFRTGCSLFTVYDLNYREDFKNSLTDRFTASEHFVLLWLCLAALYIVLIGSAGGYYCCKYKRKKKSEEYLASEPQMSGSHFTSQINPFPSTRVRSLVGNF